MKRRIFLKNTLTASAGLALAPHLEAAMDHPTPKKIIVAGAGITGLCCAYELMKAGHDVLVLEASGRYGGHVYTGRAKPRPPALSRPNATKSHLDCDKART